MKLDARFFKQRRIVAQSVVHVVVVSISTHIAIIGIIVENAALVIVRTLSALPATAVRLCPCVSSINSEVVTTRVMHRR